MISFSVGHTQYACSTLLVTGTLTDSNIKDFAYFKNSLRKAKEGFVSLNQESERCYLKGHSHVLVSVIDHPRYSKIKEYLPKLGFTRMTDYVYNEKNQTNCALFYISCKDLIRKLKEDD